MNPNELNREINSWQYGGYLFNIICKYKNGITQPQLIKKLEDEGWKKSKIKWQIRNLYLKGYIEKRSYYDYDKKHHMMMIYSNTNNNNIHDTMYHSDSNPYRYKKHNYIKGSDKNPDGSIHAYPLEYSSNYNKPYYEYPVYSEPDKDTNIRTFLYYDKFKCDDCGEIIRYDKRGDGVCPICGLIY